MNTSRNRVGICLKEHFPHSAYSLKMEMKSFDLSLDFVEIEKHVIQKCKCSNFLLQWAMSGGLEDSSELCY